LQREEDRERSVGDGDVEGEVEGEKEDGDNVGAVWL
jgi:hypothetical protein